MVSQTSLLSYVYLEYCGVIGQQELKVYQVIKEYPSEIGLCDLVLAQLLNLPINVVSARRNSLVKKGLIVCAGVFPSPITGRSVQFWISKEKSDGV